MQSECDTPSLKKLEQLKPSPSTKVLLLINLSQRNTRSSAECGDHCDKIKTISERYSHAKSYNNKYVIASAQITNTGIVAFLAALVFKLLSAVKFCL